MIDDRIHILQVAKSSGGVGMYTRRLVNAFDKSRYRFTVVCLAEGSDIMAADLNKIEGVKAISIPMQDGIEPFSDILICFRLAKLIRSEKYDLIHAHTSKPGFFTRLAAIGMDIPVIYHPANFAFHENVPRSQAVFYAFLERLAARYLTDRIILVCNGERELARQYSVGMDDQFVTIHTGIDLHPFEISVDRAKVRAGFGIPADVRLTGIVARFTLAKAPADFIHAAALVHARYPQAHFLWVGDGPLEHESRSLVKSLGLQSVFHFAGYQDNIPAILMSLDCFLLSSHWEGFSIAILEAMAAGLPVIATRVTGADEAIVDGKTGILVNVGDVNRLADAVCKLVGDVDFARSMGKAARRRAESEFPYAKMLDRIEKLYLDLIQSRSNQKVPVNF
ncbi:MAG: glycosyltransferase family 4 protein [Anaerolineales bacterium]